MLNVILCMDSKYGIGLNNNLPWGITDELKIFKEKTQNSILIVGRKTAESLPILHNRLLFVVSRTLENSLYYLITSMLRLKKH